MQQIISKRIQACPSLSSFMIVTFIFSAKTSVKKMNFHYVNDKHLENAHFFFILHVKDTHLPISPFPWKVRTLDPEINLAQNFLIAKLLAPHSINSILNSLSCHLLPTCLWVHLEVHATLLSHTRLNTSKIT